MRRVNVQPVARPTLASTVAAQLRDMVLNGELAAGQQLPGHRELARMFGVSMACMREAISSLAAAGLLEAQPGKGTYVRQDLAPDIGSEAWLGKPAGQAEREELVEARGLLECALARLAAQRATPKQAGALVAIASEMGQHLDDPDRYLAADLSFHMALAAAAHNRVLLRAMYAIRASLRRDLQRSLQRTLGRDGAVRQTVAMHARLAAAVSDADPDRAEAAAIELVNCAAADLAL